jgi:UDPglucose 6-dehydrogenase
VGTDDKEAGDKLAAFYACIGYDESLLARMDAINAEIAKLTLNAFLAMKIAFANSVAGICRAVPGGYAEAVLEVIGRDSRIGSRYLRGGAPYGGPCLPRDNEALVRLAEDHGVAPILARAVAESNLDWYLSLLQSVVMHAPRLGATFGVIGLSYKPGTDYLEGGFGLALARDLVQRGYKVVACEPGMHVSQHQSLPAIDYVDDVDEIARVSDVCVLTYPDKALGDRLRSAARRTAVIDIWHLGEIPAYV